VSDLLRGERRTEEETNRCGDKGAIAWKWGKKGKSDKLGEEKGMIGRETGWRDKKRREAGETTGGGHEEKEGNTRNR